MPKQILTFYRFLFSIWAILQIFTFARAETPETVVEIQFETGKPARVSGKYADSGRKNLSFLSTIAGGEALGKRISDVKLTDREGKPVSFRKLQDGEFFADREFTGWSYTFDLTPAANTPVAHVSWATDKVGLIMTGDILPLQGKERPPVRLILTLPMGWTALTTEKRETDGTFVIGNIDDAVFMIGSDLQTGSVPRAEERFAADIGITGRWHFTLNEALEMLPPILSEYRKAFGSGTLATRVNIVPHPNTGSHGVWQAETRGRTVTIVSSDMAFRTQSLQRLHEQLRHELFHLWLPNGVSLTGNYDWFYEGFAGYQSLRTGVALNRISFNDFLATLSSAYAIDKRQKQRSSMLEASQNRWSGRNTEIYARGMIIAFMCDVAMMDASGGKRQIAEVFREIYARHAFPAAAADANESIIKMMNNHRELRPIIDRYITGGEAIDLSPTLVSTGLELSGQQEGSLRTTAKPSSRQKTILDRLGYNNWRKSPKYLK